MSLPLTPTILLTILFAPLAAFVIQILLGYRLFTTPDRPNRAMGAVVSLLGIFIPLALVLIYVAPYLWTATSPYLLPVHGHGAVWMDLGAFQVRIGLMVDGTTKVLIFMVTLVCSMIHLFSVGYMKLRDGEPEPRYTRFFAFLSLFTFSMILLALSDNLMTLFIGWELMGICSYLLIGFYYEKKSAQDAALKAFMTTRIGDVLLLLGIAILWTSFGSLRFEDIRVGIEDGRLAGGLLTAAGILALGGAIGKSAQFPLHTWLPDAMEGPTPVSALIHAATMVAAGVYLAARMLQMGLLDSSALLFIAYIGGFTAIFAASIAFVQNDLKRVLAYSTISQLGYMMLAVGVGNYTAAVFHLLTHAFFKACLFLGSGSVIHAMHGGLHHVHSHADAQDMRNMGGLRKRLPITFWTFLVSTLALSGVPLTAGFLSKDAVLAGSLAFAMANPAHVLLPIFGFMAALMTAFYMFRLVFATFFGGPAEHCVDERVEEIREAHTHIHEPPIVMTVPLIVLAACATWLLWSPSNPFSEGWIGDVLSEEPIVHAVSTQAHDAHAPANDVQIGHEPVDRGHDSHAAHNATVVLSLILAASGIGLAYMFFGARKWSSGRFANSTFAGVLVAKYGLDELYAWAFIKNFMRVASASAWHDLRVIDRIVDGVGRTLVGGRYSFTWLNGAIDQYVVDGGVDGVAWVLRRFSAGFQRLQTGMVQSYLLVVFTGVVVLIFIISATVR